jgi:hypothetical protein
MKKTIVYAACSALVVPLTALITSPVAGAYGSCAEARAAGAAPLYAGQPGYSRKLDRDGDGVACESGGSGGAPVYAPAPLVPAAPPTSTTAAPVTPSPLAGAGSLVAVVDWTGADCIDITVPVDSDPSATQVTNRCGGHAEFAQSAGDPTWWVGADPAIGAAATLSCEIQADVLLDSGVANDGQDVNCLVKVDQLS